MDKPMIEMSEQLFNVLFDKAPVYAYIVDYQTGEILMLNNIVIHKINKKILTGVIQWANSKKAHLAYAIDITR